MTLHLYGFNGESVIPEGTIKLAITLGEAPQMATTVIDFLVVNYPSTFNRVLDPESSHIHSLLDDEVPYHSRDRLGPRKIVGLKRML